MCVGFGRKNSLHQWLQLRNIVNLCKFSRRRRRCCCPLCAAPMRQAQRRERARHSSRRSRGRNANNINAVAVAVAPHRHDLHNFWRVWGGWGVAFCLICMWPSCCCLSDSDCVCPKCVCVCGSVSHCAFHSSVLVTIFATLRAQLGAQRISTSRRVCPQSVKTGRCGADDDVRTGCTG